MNRPTWCPHIECAFRKRVGNLCCSGKLEQPQNSLITHRLCLTGMQLDDGITELKLSWDHCLLIISFIIKLCNEELSYNRDVLTNGKLPIKVLWPES